MKETETAAAWAESVAADDSHGYDQRSRWGPDYDCSSLVIEAYERAGVPVKTRGAVYTGNMAGVFLACGFRDVTGTVDLASGAGLVRGDVLLNTVRHTALYLGGGRLVHAAGNELGGAAGGRTGDQTGREITTAAYYNFPWDRVLRYGESPEDSAVGAAGTYTVRAGDSLWSVAEKLLGDGRRWTELYALNGLADATIRPGQVLRLPGETPPGEESAVCTPSLPVLRPGDAGPAVAAAQTLLLLRGAALPRWGADGEFGAETAAAVAAYLSGGEIGAAAWEALVGGGPRR